MNTQNTARATLLTVWNTGRQYTAEGQIIAAAIVGDSILFADVSRGIQGAIFPHIAESYIHPWTTPEEFKRVVMQGYDAGAYEWEGIENAETMAELKTMAAEFIAAEVNATK